MAVSIFPEAPENLRVVMNLTDDEFMQVIRTTPLIAIDLIIQNELGEILLGKRLNRPARNYWFVPGGRIRKNERSLDALERIGRSELGITLPPGKLLGAFDHFYDNNYFGVPGVDTHYVTLGYRLEVKKSSPVIQDEQHTELRWWNIDALLSSDEVHQNTKMYFSGAVSNPFKGDCI